MTATVPTLLYDDSCPMCALCTATFRAAGWSDRAALGSCDADTLGRLDLDRARHEIPLFDPATGAVTARLARHAHVPVPVAALSGVLAGSHQLWRRRFLRDRH